MNIEKNTVKIDFRSDTVTVPTDEMRRVMAAASVGDDGYDEDPSVHRLQDQVASLLGKEAAIFMPSGVMSNQAALMLHTKPGDMLILGGNHHIAVTERESTTRIAGLRMIPIGQSGIFALEEVEEAYFRHREDASFVRLISIENTVNFGGGALFPLTEIEKIFVFAKRHRLAVHIDGARLMNAVVKEGIPAIEFGRLCDTVCICLSKGLGAPVGSVLAGTRDQVSNLRRIRKILGGTMRQAGILAAAGSYALSNHVSRLAEDHRHAEWMARGLLDLGFHVDPWPQTNIVNLTTPFGSVLEWSRWLSELGIWVNVIPTGQIRLVTHLGIEAEHIQQAIARITGFLRMKQTLA